MESKNILIRWYEDGFPPIDLNSQSQSVVWLIREYRSLQKDCNLVKQTVTSKIKRIAELEAELAALRGQNQWISVEERLPEPQGGDDVWKADCSTQLEVWLDGGYDIGVYWPKINEWRIRNKHGDWKPSHWRPLSPPQTQTKERK